MSLNLDLPRVVVEALGSNPERGALEAVLLVLTDEDRISVTLAGEILGLGDQPSAARWYASRGYFGTNAVGEHRAEEEALARARPYEPVGLPPGKADVLPPCWGVSDQLLQDKRDRDY